MTTAFPHRRRHIALATALTAAAIAAGCAANPSTLQPKEATMSTSATATQNAPLSAQAFNPGPSAIFAVSSVLVAGRQDAVLIDAQFSAEQARKLVDLIKASGKRLTTIYISHGDPDYYFGLDTLLGAFPEAKVVATPATVAHIQATQAEKLKVWGPQLGANAPQRIVIPQSLQGDTLTLEGHPLKIIGLDGPTPNRTFVWIEAIRTVAGGIPVASGEHVWMADTQTPQSHADWLATLERIKALNPAQVIPGHYENGVPPGIAAVNFTGDYIRAFDEETAKASNSAELIAAMKKRYPGLGGERSLELSAKVAKGEMAWK